MINARIVSLFFLTLIGFGCEQSRQSVVLETSQYYPQELSQLHQNTLINILQEVPDVVEVEVLLSTMQNNGSWVDIDYASKQRGAWEPRNHLSNLLSIAKAYQSIDCELYQQKEVSEKIHLSLNYWLDNDFVCPNWWYPVIGVPIVLNPIMLLMEPELSAKQLEQGLAILGRCKIGKTGQNKVWQSGNVLLTSLLTRDIELVTKAANSIKEELVVSLGEGVQPDWSYHQHGPQLQFGNYGLSYVGDMIKWVTIMRNTPVAFDEKKVSILRNYLLDGQQWVIWKNQLDISACGRQLFVNSPELKAASLSKSFGKMETVDSEFAPKYKSANDYRSLVGNKHFWRSDFQVQRTNDYYFSVKMSSNRVIGAESCNSENIQGYHGGDGVSFLYQSREEHRDIFPFLDWKKLPGITVHQSEEPLPVLTCGGYRIESDFVGGVSDGKNGIAVLDYNRNGLVARKSWFMLDDMIFCLGIGISSQEGLQVNTGINQVFMNGQVIIKTKADERFATENETIEDASWMLHDNVGYLFPNATKLKLNVKNVEGSWNRVARRYPDERIHNDIFNLWIDHGKDPNNESYNYILVPNADKSILNQLERDSNYTIINEEKMQLVARKDGLQARIVLYEAGKVNAFGGIEVNQPCLLILEKLTDGIQISISDPTQKLSNIGLTINGKFEGEYVQSGDVQTKVNIPLPTGGQAGKTVSIYLKKN